MPCKEALWQYSLWGNGQCVIGLQMLHFHCSLVTGCLQTRGGILQLPADLCVFVCAYVRVCVCTCVYVHTCSRELCFRWSKLKSASCIAALRMCYCSCWFSMPLRCLLVNRSWDQLTYHVCLRRKRCIKCHDSAHTLSKLNNLSLAYCTVYREWNPSAPSSQMKLWA